MNLFKNWKIAVAHHLPVSSKPLPKPYLDIFNKQKADDESPFFNSTSGIPGLNAKNSTWGEISSLFYLQHTASPGETIGLFHYRRHLDLIGLPRKIITREMPVTFYRIISLLNLIKLHTYKNKVVLTQPLDFSQENMSVLEQFNFCHQPLVSAMDRAVKIFDELVVDQYDFSARDFMTKNSRLMPCNIFIAPQEFITEWLDILYPILFELDQNSSEFPTEGYQSRWGGFIAERLFSCFCEMKMKNADIEFVYKPLIKFT